MKYAIDTEFIDTPSCSALISLAIVREDEVRPTIEDPLGGRLAYVYFEFDYPEDELTPWLVTNVVRWLGGGRHRLKVPYAAAQILDFIGDDVPEFWAYYGAYDFYWLSRVLGGFMQFPRHWGIQAFHEFAHVQRGVPDVAGSAHNALSDARSLMAAMRARGIVS